MLKKIFAEALPSLAKATASVVKEHKGKGRQRYIECYNLLKLRI